MCFIWALGSPFQAELVLLGTTCYTILWLIYMFGHDVCDVCVAK